ncbi:amidase [Parvibaculum sp.]|uniref:amidase n=1 Tax=Parvibaculum sp. TaxID=2024848 RepID=UPI0025F602B8|nr:amidase [Parvibaculum sp.]|tara:strand:+ start:23467 stop:24957 length:1491 start_codon:yes stop_codon:yes gene_type:complete
MGLELSRRTFLKSTAATALAAGAYGAGLRPALAAPELAKLDALAQAELVAKGEMTALDLVNAGIERIEQVNPKVNAVVTEFYDRAREAAKGELPQGPFTGVPNLVKDLDNLAGTRATSGSRLFADNISKETDPLIASDQEAGFVMVGKSNTPEFGLLGTTEPLLLEPCRNPWNLEHSTGGSSGGAAAAVASGMVPLAHATDGGGSIRIPASCCGVFGLKPSRGRIFLGGRNLPGDIGVQHCVSRSVRDSATLMDLSEMKGEKAVLAPIGRVEGPGKKRLKIAFNTENYYGVEPDADVKAAIEETAKLCADLGHEIVPVKNPVDGRAFIDAFLTVWASGPSQLVALAKENGVDPEAVLEPWTIGLAKYYDAKPADALEVSLNHFAEVTAKTKAFMADYDVWLTPVLASAPPKLGEQAPTVPFDTLYERTVEYVSYTPLHNVVGTPAMSVPLSWNDAGLPIGSQFAAPLGGEKVLYELAFELEQARPWGSKYAPVFAG